MAARIQIHRTSTANSPPTANYLLPGELAIEMNAPVRLWSGVPTALDATGRKLIFQLPLTVAQGGTGATSQADALTNLGGPFAPLTNPANGTQNYAPLANATFTGTTTLSAAVSGTNLPLAVPNGVCRPLFIDTDNGIKRTDGFHVIQIADQIGMEIRSANTIPNFHPYLIMRKTRGTLAAPLATQAGDFLGMYEFKGWPVPTTGEGTGKCTFAAVALQNFTAAVQGQYLQFAVVPEGRTQQYTILDIISRTTGVAQPCRSTFTVYPDDGVSGLSDWAPWEFKFWTNSHSLSHRSKPVGVWWMNDQPGWNICVYVPGTIESDGPITPGSDERDKEAIVPLEYGLPEVRKLKARRWFWRNGNHTPQAGVVAQELEPIIPEAVVTKELPQDKTQRDHKYVNPMALIGVLIKAVQQLADRLDALETQ